MWTTQWEGLTYRQPGPRRKGNEENGKEILFKDKMPENFARIDVKYESSDSEIRMNLKNKNK